MGNPLKLRTAKMLHRGLLEFKQRVDQVFGDYDPADSTYEGDVQRARRSRGYDWAPYAERNRLTAMRTCRWCGRSGDWPQICMSTRDMEERDDPICDAELMRCGGGERSWIVEIDQGGINWTPIAYCHSEQQAERLAFAHHIVAFGKPVRMRKYGVHSTMNRKEPHPPVPWWLWNWIMEKLGIT